MARIVARPTYSLSCLVCVLLVAALARGADETADTYVYDEDVEYGSGDGEKLHLDLAYPTKGEGPFPAVVCIHGGGWRGGDRSMFRPLVKQLADRGYVAVTVQYRFAPTYKFPAQVEDVKCAVRWLRANAEKYKIDKDRFGAIGGSAGGHLALMLGLMDEKDGLEGKGGCQDQSSEVQCVVNIFGPTDLLKKFPDNIEPLLVDFVGGAIADKQEEIKQASPLTYLDESDGAILTFHGDKDDIVPYNQAELLDEACQKTKVEHTLVKMEGEGHGWGGEKMLKTTVQSMEFFDKHLKSKAQESDKE